jgi:uncharacterized protein YbcI
MNNTEIIKQIIYLVYTIIFVWGGWKIFKLLGDISYQIETLITISMLDKEIDEVDYQNVEMTDEELEKFLKRK